MKQPLPPSLTFELAALNEAVAALNLAVNPTPQPIAVDGLRPADWDSPLRLEQDKADLEDPYL